VILPSQRKKKGKCFEGGRGKKEAYLSQQKRVLKEKKRGRKHGSTRREKSLSPSNFLKKGELGGEIIPLRSVLGKGRRKKVT